MLTEIGENGETYEVKALPHRREFDQVWNRVSASDQTAIKAEMNRRLDELVASPSPDWGSIMNTSIEGGKPSPQTGVRADWTGTPFQALFHACRDDEDVAGMYFGNVFKLVIDRPEKWIGIRFDPTFPQRGITLQGKTYFLAR
jgi:hypothetical protein